MFGFLLSSGASIQNKLDQYPLQSQHVEITAFESRRKDSPLSAFWRAERPPVVVVKKRLSSASNYTGAHVDGDVASTLINVLVFAEKKEARVEMAIAIGVPALVVLILIIVSIIVCCCYCHRRRKLAKQRKA